MSNGPCRHGISVVLCRSGGGLLGHAVPIVLSASYDSYLLGLKRQRSTLKKLKDAHKKEYEFKWFGQIRLTPPRRESFKNFQFEDFSIGLSSKNL